MRLCTRQMAVIMILMHDHHRGRAVDHGPAFLACLVDHPIVPARTADDEVGNIDITGPWEQKKIASCGTMKLILFSDRFSQLRLPVPCEVNWRSDVIIPALT